MFENYSIRKRSQACDTCQQPFKEGEEVFSHLLFNNSELNRLDLCKNCAKPDKDQNFLSNWQIKFSKKFVQKNNTIEKNKVETLLRDLIEKNDNNFSVIYILAVMLERKKILIERAVQINEAHQKFRVYEHKYTSENFIILDPNLKLNELIDVQNEVIKILDDFNL